MRISIVRGDRGYDPTHSRRVERVTVDGLPVAAVTADEEEGFVDELVPDGEGGFKLDPVDGSPLTRRTTGKVEVVLRAAAATAWDKERRGEAQVRVGREPGSGDLLVQVYSVARPGAIKQGRLDLLQLPSDDAAVCQKAGITAGWLAELLCEQFGDRLDPSECARVAVEQCHRLLCDEARG